MAVNRDLSEISETLPIEFHATLLKSLPKAQRQEAWLAALASQSAGKVPLKAVKAAIAAVRIRHGDPPLDPNAQQDASDASSDRNLEFSNPRIICADVFDGLDAVPNRFDLILTSPRFNVGEKYDRTDDRTPHKEYLAELDAVISALTKKLADGGRLVFHVADTQGDDGEGLHPLDVETLLIARKVGLSLYRRHYWYKQDLARARTTFGSYDLPSDPHVARNVEHVLVFCKGRRKREIDRSKVIVGERFDEYRQAAWFINPEVRKFPHPCPWPEELPERILRFYGQMGDTVLDCFNGIGTATLVAARLKMDYYGIDHSESYCREARRRIAEGL